MKKLTYVLIALSSLALSCTKSNIVDVPEAQKTPITFETYNGKIPVTKAAEITKDNIREIQVYGFHAQNGTASYTSTYMDPKVSRTYNDETKVWSAWSYSPLSYWPASGTLGFVAHGTNTPRFVATDQRPVPTPGELVPVDGSYVEFTYAVPTAVADQQDLIVAYVAPASTAGTVSLNMKHLLSRVGFKLQTVGSGTSVTISEVSLNGKFVNNGTVDLSNGTAITPKSGTLDAEDYTTSYSLLAEGETFTIASNESATEGTPIFASGKSEADRYMMIMPGTVADNDQAVDEEIGTTPYIQVTYQLGEGIPQTKKLPLVDGDVNWNFVSGTAYEFIFKVSISQIEFEGEVVDWDEDINGDGKEDADDYID